MTDADRIAFLENEVAYLRSELALCAAVDDVARMMRVFGLTPQEAEILYMLCAANGRCLTFDFINDNAPNKFPPDRGRENTKVHVHRIRKAIGKSMIQTVYSIGYCVPADRLIEIRQRIVP